MNDKQLQLIDSYKQYGFTYFILENKHTRIKIGCKDSIRTMISIMNKTNRSVRHYTLSSVPHKYSDIINNVIVSYMLTL